MPENKALSENLKALRRMKNISQIEFAEECGISTEILSLIERGKTDPKLSTIQKIAAYAGCRVSDLLTEKGVAYLKYSYETKADVITDDCGHTYPVYGITVFNSETKEIVNTYPDIFFDKDSAAAFTAFCNAEGIDPKKLPDIIEDILP